MPKQAEQTTVTPARAGDLVGVEVYTIRRWCDWHAAHLSPGASPGPGAPKRVTMRDIEVLRAVRDMRAQGLTTIAINEQLIGLTFAEIDTTNEQPDNSTDAHLLPTLPSQTGEDSAPGAIVAQEDYLIALERRFEALEASTVETKQYQRDRWWWLVAGIVIGLSLAFVAEMFVLIVSRVR